MTLNDMHMSSVLEEVRPHLIRSHWMGMGVGMEPTTLQQNYNPVHLRCHCTTAAWCHCATPRV